MNNISIRLRKYSDFMALDVFQEPWIETEYGGKIPKRVKLLKELRVSVDLPDVVR